MFELSRSYLTPLVDGGFVHGENCRLRNAFRGFPCAMSNQLRTGADKGYPTVSLKQSIAMASKGGDTM